MMSPPDKSDSIHRVVLTFDDGVRAKLICPESGCVGGCQCGYCAADLADPNSARCYDCKDLDGGECWIKTWFDNCSADELLHGSIEVEIRAEWDQDHMIATVVDPAKVAL